MRLCSRSAMCAWYMDTMHYLGCTTPSLNSVLPRKTIRRLYRSATILILCAEISVLGHDCCSVVTSVSCHSKSVSSVRQPLEMTFRKMCSQSGRPAVTATSWRAAVPPWRRRRFLEWQRHTGTVENTPQLCWLHLHRLHIEVCHTPCGASTTLWIWFLHYLLLNLSQVTSELLYTRNVTLHTFYTDFVKKLVCTINYICTIKAHAFDVLSVFATLHRIYQAFQPSETPNLTFCTILYALLDARCIMLCVCRSSVQTQVDDGLTVCCSHVMMINRPCHLLADVDLWTCFAGFILRC